MRKFSFAILCILLSLVVFSQKDNSNLKESLNRKNAIDITIGGTGLVVSANYSRVILVKPNYFINASVGIGPVPFSGGINLPHQVTFNLGKKNNFLELGLGGTFWTGKDDGPGSGETLHSYYISSIIGWRKHFNNNFVFRAYLNPMVHVSGEYFIGDFVPYAGFSFGYTF